MGLKRLDLKNAPEGGDDTLLPDQFWTTSADPRTEPEKRLMVAVLEEAISLVTSGGYDVGEDRRAIRREAERWLASDERNATFAFASICDVLDLDPGRVRQALADWRRQRLFRRPRLQAGRGRHQVGGPRRAA